MGGAKVEKTWQPSGNQRSCLGFHVLFIVKRMSCRFCRSECADLGQFLASSWLKKKKYIYSHFPAVKESEWSGKQNGDSDAPTSSAGQNRVKLGRPAGFLLLVGAALGAVPAACSQGSLTPHCLSATQPAKGRREGGRAGLPATLLYK